MDICLISRATARGVGAHGACVPRVRGSGQRVDAGIGLPALVSIASPGLIEMSSTTGHASGSCWFAIMHVF